jgi:DNA-directed RNA polymerase subunit RPC12/RpoP
MNIRAEYTAQYNRAYDVMMSQYGEKILPKATCSECGSKFSYMVIDPENVLCPKCLSKLLKEEE